MNEKQMIIVRNLFAAHGNAEEPVRLSGGWTNHVFAAGDMVLRCTEDMQSGRLLREAQLARVLPPQVGYPEIIDSGCTENLIWTLCRRIPGMNLEDAWGAMTWMNGQMHWSSYGHVCRTCMSLMRRWPVHLSTSICGTSQR